MTSTDCIAVVNGTCHVWNADFTVKVTAATDAGGSGMYLFPYEVCRSDDAAGIGGCEHAITMEAAGNVAPWNTPL